MNTHLWCASVQCNFLKYLLNLKTMLLCDVVLLSWTYFPFFCSILLVLINFIFNPSVNFPDKSLYSEVHVVLDSVACSRLHDILGFQVERLVVLR
jgi:hypothetical protein